MNNSAGGPAVKFATFCSGIGAPEKAWKGLGWEQVFSSEIEPFPCAVMKHHYPGVPNHGDMNNFKEWGYGPGSVDLLCGGTPCQSFSVAGLRKGLDDPRGNLALVYLAAIDRMRPSWVVWENVPGVLSVDGGRAFGAFLGGLAQLGYGWAYRVLDAQYFGVPQRRRRVFVVGHLGDVGRPAHKGQIQNRRGFFNLPAAVLFERHSLSGNPPPSRAPGQGATHDTAPCIGASGRGFERAGETRGQDPVVAFDAAQITSETNRSKAEPGIPAGTMSKGSSLHVAFDMRNGIERETTQTLQSHHHGVSANTVPHVAMTLNAHPSKRYDAESETMVCHSLKARYDGSEDGTGRGVPLVAPTLRAMPNQGPGRMADDAAAMGMVRRLTPRECERLQGFPDDYTLIPYPRNPAKDGPRYKALGNSMAVPVVEWLGQRIEMVNNWRNV